jgi:hypothetical protein
MMRERKDGEFQREDVWGVESRGLRALRRSVDATAFWPA